MTCLQLLGSSSISVFFLFAEDAGRMFGLSSSEEEWILFVKSSASSFLFKMIYLPQRLFPMHNFICKLTEIVNWGTFTHTKYNISV